MRVLRAEWVVLLMLMGCGFGRVTLRPVPEKEAPREQREQALRDLAPVSEMTTTYLRRGVQVGGTINHLMLGDGTRVEDPRDLLPAVEKGSPTYNYVQSFEGRWAPARWLTGIGLGALAVSPIFIVVPLATGMEPPASSAMVVTGLGLILVGAVMEFVGIVLGNLAGIDRISAFETYPQGLQRRLGLGDQVAPTVHPPPEATVDSDRPRVLSLVP